MKFKESVFKAYDIRGLIDGELTEDLAYAVGRALADFLPVEGALAVGYDMRVGSKNLADKLIQGILEQGRDVIDIGMVTSDMIYFAVGHLRLAGGAMITASHEPGKYNGIKLCQKDARPIGVDTGLSTIKQIVVNDTYKEATQKGRLNKKDVKTEWIDHVLSFISLPDLKAFHLGIDAGNGMAGIIIPELEKRVPFRVEEMYFQPDGSFPNHPANPIDPGNLNDLINEIKTKKLDFGIAFDGDGDRAFLVDNLGRPVSSSITMAMLVEHILSISPGSPILYGVTCSHIVPETIKKCGGKAVRVRAGHSYVKADMRKYDASFAGEHSGHYYFRDNFYADSGLIAALIITAIISRSGQTLAELADHYQNGFYDSGELNSQVSNPGAKIEEIANIYKDGKLDRLDGLTVEYTDWWFNVRASNTESEPILRLNIEANSKSLLEQKIKELLSHIRK